MTATDESTTGNGAVRTLRALAGARLTPPACGMTFVPIDAMRANAADATPDVVLATAASSSRADFVFAPSWEPWAGRLVTRLRGAGIAALWVVRGVLWPTLDAVGVEEGLMLTARDSEALAPALDAATGAMLDAVALGIGLKADAIVVADDLATTSGPLVAPDFVADAVLPRLALASAAASRAGLPALLHSDGETSAFLRGLRASGFSGVHVGGLGQQAFERICGRARPEGLAVLGGLGACELASPPAAVLSGTRLSILAASGGLLIADDGGVTTPNEYAALLVALEAARVLP